MTKTQRIRKAIDEAKNFATMRPQGDGWVVGVYDPSADCPREGRERKYWDAVRLHRKAIVYWAIVILYPDEVDIAQEYSERDGSIYYRVGDAINRIEGAKSSR